MTHTHDDPNITCAPLGTDVYDWLAGEGFVMAREEWTKPLPVVPSIASNGSNSMPSIADEVRVLEGFSPVTEGTRIVWRFIIAAVVVGLATYAFGSPSPFKEIPATSTRTATDAVKPLARCVQVTTVQRFLMKPDGTMLPISGRVMLMAGC